MYLLFEDAGKFLAGRILSETDASSQVELASGKRQKVKAANALIRFEQPSPADLLAQASHGAQDIDLDLAWECASDEEFGFADMASEYFGEKPTVAQQASALMRLFEAPHYFRRAGKGRFKKASAEVLQQALAAIEKKAAVQAQVEQWTSDLATGTCPEPIAQQLYKILFKPDKNAPEHKAVVAATKQTQLGPLQLLQQAGAIHSAFEFHWQRFLFDQFPKGIAFPPLSAPAIDTGALPLSEAHAFSIDDSNTTEIDDALSVRGLGSGTVTLGIHIAAPALAIKPGDAIDVVARSRMSTMYMPGFKVTMLPDEVVQHYTLAAGRDCPALSLYVTIDEHTLAIGDTTTVVERVHIADNLRHDQLGDVFNDAFFDADAEPQDMPRWGREMRFLHRLAKQLKAGREVVRGKPETFNRPDYNFSLVKPQGASALPVGDETVEITVRPRGSNLDLVVAEAMILANSTWGQWLGALGVPGIYRSQASLAPGVKVRMGTKMAPHAGIGVPAYAWSTSPLRRYTDMINQWQLIACAQHGATAALVAPFKPKDAALFAIISGFDETYSAYNQFQNAMERYWTLRYLDQQGITDITAVLFKDGLVRADDVPLVVPVIGAQHMPRGAHVRVKLGAPDPMALDISGSIIERLDANDVSADTSDIDFGADGEGDDADGLDTGSLKLAMDLSDEPSPAHAEVNADGDGNGNGNGNTNAATSGT
jgi:exoribonuclease II